MRTLSFLILGLFAAASSADDDAVKKDMTAMNGEWTMVSGVSNGKAMAEDRIKTGRRIIKDGVTELKFNNMAYLTAKFTIDPAKKPREIDYTVTEGTNKGKMTKGIYELDGDTLKFCFAQPDADRPTKFESAEDSGHVYSVWKRAEKKDK
jgi:uncharacterized protein (TIGR03067 family)